MPGLSQKLQRASRQDHRAIIRMLITSNGKGRHWPVGLPSCINLLFICFYVCVYVAYVVCFFNVIHNLVKGFSSSSSMTFAFALSRPHHSTDFAFLYMLYGQPVSSLTSHLAGRRKKRDLPPGTCHDGLLSAGRQSFSRPGR